jgi:hypothetical protein
MSPMTSPPDDIQDIIEMCGYDSCDRFPTEADVRAYFTVDNMVQMFREPCTWTQDEMDKAANWVTEHRYHMGADE